MNEQLKEAFIEGVMTGARDEVLFMMRSSMFEGKDVQQRMRQLHDNALKLLSLIDQLFTETGPEGP